MAIPKYITHPIIIGFIASGLAYVMWLQSPSEQTLQNAKSNVQSTSAPSEQILPENLVQITNFNEQSCLEFKDHLIDNICITAPQFQKLNSTQLQNMKTFFTHKWILKPDDTTLNLDLPLKLWDESCIQNNKTITESQLCPLELKL